MTSSSFVSTNPHTQTHSAIYPSLDGAGIERGLSLAIRAQLEWSRAGFRHRSAALHRLAAALEARESDLAQLIVAEMGKILPEALAEVRKCADHCRHFADEAANYLAPQPVATTATHSAVHFEPYGLVLGIMPWNFPLWQVFRFAVPALAAGNGVLLKPAPNVAGCGLAIAELFQIAGFPPGIFQTLLLELEQLPAVIQDDRIALVTFTGSEAAGRQVAALASQALKKVVLELGGSDAFIVCADANLEIAVASALSSRLANAGQVCIAAKRFLLEQPIAAAFEEALLAQLPAWTSGDPLAPSTRLGPLARPDLAAKLSQQIQTSQRQGAQLRYVGARSGVHFEPVVLAQVQPEHSAFQEETFGPLFALATVASLDEAIAWANHSRYGLSASIWSQDTARAAAMAPQLAVGSVFVNAVVRSDSRLPLGGVKASGFGRELGALGIQEFCRSQSLWLG